MAHGTRLRRRPTSRYLDLCSRSCLVFHSTLSLHSSRTIVALNQASSSDFSAVKFTLVSIGGSPAPPTVEAVLGGFAVVAVETSPVAMVVAGVGALPVDLVMVVVGQRHCRVEKHRRRSPYRGQALLELDHFRGILGSRLLARLESEQQRQVPVPVQGVPLPHHCAKGRQLLRAPLLTFSHNRQRDLTGRCAPQFRVLWWRQPQPRQPPVKPPD